MSGGIGDKMRGKGEEIVGRAKGTIGDMTDSERLQGEGMVGQVEGKGRQAEGGIKGALDNLGDKIGDTVDNVKDKVAGNDEPGMGSSRRAENLGTGSGELHIDADDLADDKTKRTR